MGKDSVFIEWIKNKKNIVLVGEAGCGKSEAAIHIAVELARIGEKQVHLFDMDQTKPLYRSRDVSQVLAESGVICHFETQMMDAPTLVGGIEACFEDMESYVVVDVGGNETGARLIGGLSRFFPREDTQVLYLINPYRPWSKDIYSIDSMMTEVLHAARIRDFKIVGSPSLGRNTTPDEAIAGCGKLTQILTPYAEAEYFFIADSIFDQVKDQVPVKCEPIHLYLSYPWDDE